MNKIDVQMQWWPGSVGLPQRTRPRDQDATTLQDSVYVRLADPTQPLEGPRCI